MLADDVMNLREKVVDRVDQDRGDRHELFLGGHHARRDRFRIDPRRLESPMSEQLARSAA
jgi:hypothetical protein